MTARGVTRTAALMNAVRTQIACRALVPGDRLPSVGRFAETMAVSPSTVVEVYDRLAAEGVIRATGLRLLRGQHESAANDSYGDGDAA